ncbi:phytoene desaturase family protein [Streptomyces sp. NPDC020192]|uniref:phytoene desaturase family protein n=1 Tax=Streptomyces sp. NPDC020192 TaxID=3365066 RepID=UPI0037A319D7
MTSAVMVGAGPNGLAAAAFLARAGLEVTVLEAADETGGGTRSSEALLPGLLHDHCSAIHPTAVTSPALRALGLEQHGLRRRTADVDCVHPLDDGSAGVLPRSVPDTARLLGPDGDRYRPLLATPERHWDALAHDVLGPLLRVPSHPLLLTVGHAAGWAVAEGGSQSIARAMERVLRTHGGTVHTGVRVTDPRQLPPADVTLLDLDPGQVAALYGDRLPAPVRGAYRRFRRAPAVFKLDLAVEGGVPWTNEHARRAATVHLGGPLAEVARAEQDVVAGHMPERPFVLVGRQYLADPSRSAGDIHPVYTYAHVPYGYDADATEAILGQVERFAPGVRDRIVGSRAIPPARFATANPNFTGGDIITGAKTTPQLLLGPRPALDPYATGLPGVFLCSAATPPGPGAHGMCGAGAAASALRHLGIPRKVMGHQMT